MSSYNVCVSGLSVRSRRAIIILARDHPLSIGFPVVRYEISSCCMRGTRQWVLTLLLSVVSHALP